MEKENLEKSQENLGDIIYGDLFCSFGCKMKRYPTRRDHVTKFEPLVFFVVGSATVGGGGGSRADLETVAFEDPIYLAFIPKRPLSVYL